MAKCKDREINEKLKKEMAVRKEIIREFEKIEEALTKAIFVLLIIIIVMLCIILFY